MCQQSSARTSPGLVSLPEFVQLLHKIMNAKIAEAVGINQFKILVIGNIDMWRHPKYYKELRKLRNKLDQAISEEATDGFDTSVRPDPGPKLQASEDSTANSTRGRVAEPEATSSKPQAPSSDKNK